MKNVVANVLLSYGTVHGLEQYINKSLTLIKSSVMQVLMVYSIKLGNKVQNRVENLIS